MDKYRLSEFIHKRFDDLLESIREDYLLKNAGYNSLFTSARNDIEAMVYKAEFEYVALKKYNILIDFLSKENERIILNNIDTPFWLNGEIDQERPPGLTQKELDELLKKINEKFAQIDEVIPWHKLQSSNLYFQFDSFRTEISILIKDAFCVPNKNLKFTKGLYDRNVSGHPFFSQNTPCEICGENRAIDSCHIIPNHLGGNLAPGNLLYLCPTHHRLFDRFLLSKDEFDKIKWQSKSKAASNFAFLVFRPIFEATWEKMEKGIYEKNGDPITLTWGPASEAIEAMILEIVNENEGIDVSTIASRIEINQTECKMFVRELANKNKLRIAGGRNFRVHRT